MRDTVNEENKHGHFQNYDKKGGTIMDFENESFSVNVRGFGIWSFDAIERMKSWHGWGKQHFDLLLDPGDLLNNKYASASDILLITVSSARLTYTLALLAGVLKWPVNYALLEGCRLTLLLEADLVQIGLHDGQIVHYVPLDHPDYFSVYPTRTGYIVHGETEIVALDRQFNIKWRYRDGGTFIHSLDESDFIIQGNQALVCGGSQRQFMIDIETGKVTDCAPQALE